jgi:hypothetical protein
MNGRPWLRALTWLVFLAPFFFLTYSFANSMAAQRSHVAELMFPWERYIPFLGWTIVPYWASDLLYGISLFICATRAELDEHGKRLVAIQLFAVACFIAFPMRCIFERPALDGWVGTGFAALKGFDQPFNQAPSLHVALAVILWMRFRAHTPHALQIPLAACLALVAISALTTYQHHFIDLPMGAWAGVLAMAAFPERRVAEPQVKLTLMYLAGSVASVAAAFWWQGFGWLLLWPGFALSMVAAAYWTGDSAWLGKNHWLMTPYTLGAWINSRLWTRKEAPRNHLVDSVWIGRAPSMADRKGINSVVDLAPELSIRGDAHVAMLDLSPPTDDQLEAAVQAIIRLGSKRPTLVCCALGYSRSAVASAAWLIAAGHAADTEEALAQVKVARPQVVIGPKLKLRLYEWADRRNANAG